MPKLATLEPLVVFYRLWNRIPGRQPYSALIEGKEITFESLAEARTYAATHGYKGIQVRPWRE